MKNNKGRALVSTIIIIVIACILVAITIAMLTGENSGVFTAKVSDEKIKTLETEAKEKMQTAQLALKAKIEGTHEVNLTYDATSKDLEDSGNIYELADYVLTELEGAEKKEFSPTNLVAMTTKKQYVVTLDDNEFTIKIQYKESALKNSIGMEIKVTSDNCIITDSNFDSTVKSNFSGYKR